MNYKKLQELREKEYNLCNQIYSVQAEIQEEIKKCTHKYENGKSAFTLAAFDTVNLDETINTNRTVKLCAFCYLSEAEYMFKVVKCSSVYV